MLFNDYMRAVALRMREPEAAGTVQFAYDAPYLLEPELQGIVYAALLQTLKEVPKVDFDSFSGAAVTIVTGGTPTSLPNISGMPVPINAVRVLGVTIDGLDTVKATPAGLGQAVNMPPNRNTNRYTFMQGRVFFVGTNIVLTLLVEPTLDDWRVATKPILPPGFDIRAIDLAHKRVLIADYVPAWRP